MEDKEIRDMFAWGALVGMGQAIEWHSHERDALVALRAYEVADAMMKEREKKGE